ncbi:hypothetical protein HK097_007851 [Rhizophlyctis rosea]|uniref:Uncharacterized protein n=1 Tax=Rhizophlyctis rosea TaxID=64517 RepID=A0AAD5SB17_9FUNG|nr:hypothetical protein HK097_007851 [Rhizophlyctis rosea]
MSYVFTKWFRTDFYILKRGRAQAFGKLLVKFLDRRRYASKLQNVRYLISSKECAIRVGEVLQVVRDAEVEKYGLCRGVELHNNGTVLTFDYAIWQKSTPFTPGGPGGHENVAAALVNRNGYCLMLVEANDQFVVLW